jgi:hypothetical protein
MIKFIKNLLGFGPADAYKPQETVKEILTPPVVVTTSNPADNVTLQATYSPPAKPVNKVKALGESGADAVKAAVASKPANKQRKPYRGNKPKGVKASGTVAKVNQPKPQAKQAPKPAKKK